MLKRFENSGFYLAKLHVVEMVLTMAMHISENR
jgi:hypothetical protein